MYGCIRDGHGLRCVAHGVVGGVKKYGSTTVVVGNPKT